MNIMHFKSVQPNYRKKVLEICLVQKNKKYFYNLPFSVFTDLKITRKNYFKKISIDKMLRDQALEFELTDGSTGDFAVDFVLYHCEPSYEFSALNQVKNALKKKISKSGLSVRVLANAIQTSPSQVLRLLQENQISKQWQQISHLARLVGCRLDLTLAPL